MLSFLIFPFYAVGNAYISNNDIEGYSIEFELVISYFIHLIVMIVIANIIAMNKVTLNKTIDNLVVNGIMNKSILIAVLGCIVVFVLGGYQIIFQGMYRGDLRLTIGLLGPLYNFTILYLAITLVSVSSIAYILSSRVRKFRYKLIILFFIVFLTGLFAGSKATMIIITIPGIAILTIGKSIKSFSIVGIVVFFLILGMTIFVRQMEVEDAFNFMLNRATNMSAYGSVGVWNELSDGITFDQLLVNFLSIFGSHITTLLIGYERNTIEFLSSDLSRLITYLVYPDTQRALDGSVNLTVTNFGEAIFFFGKHYFWIYSILSGIILGVIIRNIKKNISLLNIKLATLFNVYFFAVILPWLNSGGTFKLISLPNFVYIGAIYILLLYITSNSKKGAK